MGAVGALPPSKRLSSASCDLAYISFAASWSVRVDISLVKVATVSRSAKVAVAKLAMAVTNPPSAGSWFCAYCSATLAVCYPAPLAVLEMMHCSRLARANSRLKSPQVWLTGVRRFQSLQASGTVPVFRIKRKAMLKYCASVYGFMPAFV
jgi:hypothetical protein